MTCAVCDSGVGSLERSLESRLHNNLFVKVEETTNMRTVLVGTWEVSVPGCGLKVRVLFSALDFAGI